MSETDNSAKPAAVSTHSVVLDIRLPLFPEKNRNHGLHGLTRIKIELLFIRVNPCNPWLIILRLDGLPVDVKPNFVGVLAARRDEQITAATPLVPAEHPAVGRQSAAEARRQAQATARQRHFGE